MGNICFSKGITPVDITETRVDNWDDGTIKSKISSNNLKGGPGLKLSDYQIISYLNKGHFGKVYKVISKIDKQVYSLKCIYKNSIIQDREFENLAAEREVLGSINHPFIVKMHAAFQTKEQLCFVMDYLEGNELFYHLRDRGSFDEETTMFYAAQIVLAVEHLHKNNIMYRDLKPENILLDKDGNAVLTDFGLAKLNMTKDKTTKTVCGTPEYIAPEIIENKPYDKSADWWSLGILIYEMLSGKHPYKTKNNDQAAMYKKIVEVPVKMRPEFSSEAKSLINGLLAIKNHNRLGYSDLGSEEIKYHDFFKCINWDQIENKEKPAPITIRSEDFKMNSTLKKEDYIEELYAELSLDNISEDDNVNLEKVREIQTQQKLRR